MKSYPSPQTISGDKGQTKIQANGAVVADQVKLGCSSRSEYR